VESFTPGFIPQGVESDPRIGELQLEGRFARFSGDYAAGKNPKGVLYCRMDREGEE